VCVPSKSKSGSNPRWIFDTDTDAVWPLQPDGKPESELYPDNRNHSGPRPWIESDWNVENRLEARMSEQ
jgi:hypothetical protein